MAFKKKTKTTKHNIGDKCFADVVATSNIDQRQIITIAAFKRNVCNDVISHIICLSC